MSENIFQIYYNWLFDNNLKSQIPEILLESSTPINHQYAISVFLGNQILNKYLNEYFNNINLWYISKEDLFIFLKKCVRDFNINRRNLTYISWKKDTKIIEILSSKFPQLKSFEILQLCDNIEKSGEKDSIYNALGLDKEEKVKKNKKSKNQSKDRETVQDFLNKNFRTGK